MEVPLILAELEGPSNALEGNLDAEKLEQHRVLDLNVSIRDLVTDLPVTSVPTIM
jgi:hypothetical protein